MQLAFTTIDWNHTGTIEYPELASVVFPTLPQSIDDNLVARHSRLSEASCSQRVSTLGNIDTKSRAGSVAVSSTCQEGRGSAGTRGSLGTVSEARKGSTAAQDAFAEAVLAAQDAARNDQAKAGLWSRLSRAGAPGRIVPGPLRRRTREYDGSCRSGSNLADDHHELAIGGGRFSKSCEGSDASAFSFSPGPRRNEQAPAWAQRLDTKLDRVLERLSAVERKLEIPPAQPSAAGDASADPSPPQSPAAADEASPGP
jgi:hypothetical protein